MTSPFATHGALSRGVFAVAWLVSFAVLFAPPSDVPPSPYGVDKLVHGLLFAALAVTGRWAGARPRVLAVVLVLYAAVSEVLQGTDLVDRDAAWGDLVADSAGVAVGLAVWAALARSRRTAAR
ncbi:VanZ family protein [Modestobacter sp. NPDC049651]|uniref:VanZ family protein n=1 Tax=unclassified Modestobacter TaxID=2643866 RepID=UPI0033D2AA50